MATEVIYARVPEGLKQRVEEYGEQRAMTTTTAVVDLLRRGLEAVSSAPSVAKLERRAGQLEEQLGTTVVRLREAEARVAGLKEKERSLQAAYQGLAQRTEQMVGVCPHCQAPIRGYDLFVTGHCPRCTKPVSTLLVGGYGKGGLDQKEMLLLLGAIGILVGMAYLQSK